jgi:hypothetical protein
LLLNVILAISDAPMRQIAFQTAAIAMIDLFASW